MIIDMSTKEESKYDPVSHPDHYTAGRKNDLIEDLKKARQYLDFEIEYLEKKFGMRF